MESKSETKILYGPHNTSTVYIKGISKDAKHNDVLDLCKEAGYVLDFYFTNDSEYNLPGFACATYRFEAEAKTAVELFDYRVFYDKVLRVNFPAAKDRAHKTNTNGCKKVSFTNVNMEITEEELRRRFAGIGNCVEFRIAPFLPTEYIEGGENRANGFVTFEDEKTAKLAIEKLNHLTINGVCMYVTPYISEFDRKEKEEEKKIERLRRTVVVKNFCSESSVVEFCKKKIGGVMDWNSESDEAENSSECHITFLEIGEAESAIREMNGYFDGKNPWSAGWALTRSVLDVIMKKYDAERNCHIVVKNLEKSVSPKHLKEMFSPFGEVISCEVELDSEDNSTGVGYVRFAYSKDATGAVNGMNGKVIGRKNCLSVAFDESKAEKRQKVQVD